MPESLYDGDRLWLFASFESAHLYKGSPQGISVLAYPNRKRSSGERGAAHYAITHANASYASRTVGTQSRRVAQSNLLSEIHRCVPAQYAPSFPVGRGLKKQITNA